LKLEAQPPLCYPEDMKACVNKKEEYRYLPRGVVEDENGRVAGMWIKTRRRREVFLFEKPIEKRAVPYTIVHRDITVEGRLYQHFPVKEYIEINALNHWGNSRQEKQE